MAVTSCEIDFSSDIRSGQGDGVLEDGSVDACVVQRSYLRAWCRDHADIGLAGIVGAEVPDDEPTISRVIRAYCIALNDGLPNDERQRLRPYEERILGTRTTDEDEETRAWLATDWLVRRFAAEWLRKCGLADRGDELEALPELTSAELAREAQPIIDKAKREAYAAGAAAWSAAWAAAGDAAGDAARAAAGDAARDAAGAAAWDAARAAAGDAARAVARAAARAAAWDAAGAVAWDAAGDAARAAAGDASGGYETKYAAARKAADEAIRQKLGETIVALRQEAFDLLDRMIAVGQEVPA